MDSHIKKTFNTTSLMLRKKVTNLESSTATTACPSLSRWLSGQNVASAFFAAQNLLWTIEQSKFFDERPNRLGIGGLNCYSMLYGTCNAACNNLITFTLFYMGSLILTKIYERRGGFIDMGRLKKRLGFCGILGAISNAVFSIDLFCPHFCSFSYTGVKDVR